MASNSVRCTTCGIWLCSLPCSYATQKLSIIRSVLTNMKPPIICNLMKLQIFRIWLIKPIESLIYLTKSKRDIFRNMTIKISLKWTFLIAHSHSLVTEAKLVAAQIGKKWRHFKDMSKNMNFSRFYNGLTSLCSLHRLLQNFWNLKDHLILHKSFLLFNSHSSKFLSFSIYTFRKQDWNTGWRVMHGVMLDWC